MKRKVLLFGTFVLVLLLSACTIGPKFTTDPTLPTTSTSLFGRKVIVSNFQGTRYASSVTRSGDIETLREYIGTQDISPDIAQGLRSRGIEAEARVGFMPDMLQPGEVLLRGKITVSGGEGWATNRGINWANFVIVVGTLGVVGMILPTPIPWVSVANMAYSADVIDVNGRFLAHASKTDVDVEYDSYYFWGVTGSVNKRTFTQGTERILESLIEWFKGQ